MTILALDDAVAHKRGLRIVERLASLDLPAEGSCPPIVDADSLLIAFANGCDGSGRYFASPGLLRRLAWWQKRLPSVEHIESWRDELLARGDLRIGSEGRSCYSDAVVNILTLTPTSRRRFDRFRGRPAISADLRAAVYERDGHACLTCGTTTNLSLDHIHPYSLGGPDTFENLQTLCRSCNSAKGARV